MNPHAFVGAGARLGALGSLTIALGACTFERGGRAVPVIQPVEHVEIETDVLLTADPGEFAGVVVEYLSGGQWVVTTTCDTEFTDFLCEFDIVLTLPTGTFSGLETEQLEATDEALLLADDVVQLRFETAFGRDRAIVFTRPGLPLRADVLLDGVFDPGALFWNGYGLVQDLAPSNPVEFEPTQD